MRIVIVNSYYFPEIEGGAEYSVKMLAETLKKNGNEVFVICTAEKSSVEKIEGVTVHRIKSRCIVRTKNCYTKNTIIRKMHRVLDVYNPFNYTLLKNLLKEIKPDVVHTNGLYDISPVIWTVAKHLHIPTVHTLRDYYLVCEHGNMIRRNSGDPCTKTRWLCSLYRNCNVFFSRSVSAVTAPSQYTLDVTCTAGLFRKAQKKCIFNATDIDIEEIDRIVADRKQKLGEQKVFNFVFLGTLVEFKGIKWLLDCFREISDERIRIRICGKGPLEEEIKEIAKQDHRIEFRGFLNNEEVNEVLMDSQVLICPSIWNEPFGRVVLDAYQAGMPVIVTDVGALASIAPNGKTSIVVKPYDKEELQSAIRALSFDKKLYVGLLEGILKQAEHFTLACQCEHFMHIYNIVQATK